MSTDVDPSPPDDMDARADESMDIDEHPNADVIMSTEADIENEPQPSTAIVVIEADNSPRSTFHDSLEPVIIMEMEIDPIVRSQTPSAAVPEELTPPTSLHSVNPSTPPPPEAVASDSSSSTSNITPSEPTSSEGSQGDASPAEPPQPQAPPPPPPDPQLEALLAATALGDLGLLKSLYASYTSTEDYLIKIATRAARTSHLEILTWTFTQDPSLLQKTNNNPILLGAFDANSVSVYQLLIDHGLDLNAHRNVYYGDALSYACMRGNFELVNFLLSKGHGANLGRRCSGRVAAVWAVTCESFTQTVGLSILNLLLSHGLTPEGTGAAIAAAARDNLDALILLLNAGASMEEECDWSGRDRGACTALFEACARGKARIVEYLLGRGAKNDVEDEDGRGCRDVAAKRGYQDVLRLLDYWGTTVEWPD